MQCVEVQRLVHPNTDSKAVLAAETVVDYVTKTPRNDLAFTDKTLMGDLNTAYTIKLYADRYVTLSIKLHRR